MRHIKDKPDSGAVPEAVSGGGSFALFFPGTRKMAGNLFRYIARRQPGIGARRLQDIYILITERLARRHSEPLLVVDHELWAVGIVQKDLSLDLSLDGPRILAGYLENRNGRFFADGEPDLACFDGNQREVIIDTVEFTATLPDDAVRGLVYGQGTFWEEEVRRAGLERAFKNAITLTSDVKVDFGRAIGDPGSRRAYYDAAEEMEEAGII